MFYYYALDSNSLASHESLIMMTQSTGS